MKRLLENQFLIRTVCSILIIAIGGIIYLLTSIPIMLIFTVPLFILLVVFCDWLRGIEEAKNLKHFMVFRIIILIIGVVIFVQYFLAMSGDNTNVNPWYMMLWFAVMFIGDFIEKKYFVKKDIA